MCIMRIKCALNVQKEIAVEYFGSTLSFGIMGAFYIGKTLVRYNLGFYRGITLTPSVDGSNSGINLRITF